MELGPRRAGPAPSIPSVTEPPESPSEPAEQPSIGSDAPPPPPTYPAPAPYATPPNPYAAPPAPSYPPTGPPGYPPQAPWGGYGYEPAPKSGTNGFSIAALIFGIIPICFLGIIFAIVALVQISKSRQKGKGLAIAGLVLSALWIIGIVVAAVIGAFSTADRNGTGTITSGGRVEILQLRVGDCFNDDAAPGTLVLSVEAVPCSEPHKAEVFAVVPVPGDAFPGDDPMKKKASDACTAQQDHVDASLVPSTAALHWVQPSQQMWSAHHRNVVCIVYTATKQSGSVTR